MRAENRNRAVGNLGDAFDKSRAFRLQRFDHVFVVNDLVADIDRRAVFFQRALDDVDRTHNAGAKSARLRKNDVEWTQPERGMSSGLRKLHLVLFQVLAEGLEAPWQEFRSRPAPPWRTSPPANRDR